MSEDIEIERMVRLLFERANHFTISTYNGGVNIYAAWMRSVDDGVALKIGNGPTLREALADACKYMEAMKVESKP